MTVTAPAARWIVCPECKGHADKMLDCDDCRGAGGAFDPAAYPFDRPTLQGRAAAEHAATTAALERDQLERAEEERKERQEQLAELVKKLLGVEIDVATLGEATQVTIDGLAFTTFGHRYGHGYSRPELYLRRRCLKCGTDGWDEVGSLYILGAALAEDGWKHDYGGCPEDEGDGMAAPQRQAPTPTIGERLEELVRAIVAESRAEA